LSFEGLLLAMSFLAREEPINPAAPVKSIFIS